MNTINVFEQALLGVGRRFDLELDGQQTLSVVALRDGRRQLIRHSARHDTPAVTDPDRDQAATVGALLLEAQFSIGATDGVDDEADRVVVDTITVSPDAPAAGRTPDQAFAKSDHDVVVLAVIRDHTPELVELDPQFELSEATASLSLRATATADSLVALSPDTDLVSACDAAQADVAWSPRGSGPYPSARLAWGSKHCVRIIS